MSTAASTLSPSGADWRHSTVAPDGTHHLLAGRPLYAARFLEVLKFHAPGLAPVRDASGAYHVTPDGQPAYAQRHGRTFGFYEGLAAVQGKQGWHHIHPDGRALYAERHAWCGNFQGGRCPVRKPDGSYAHIDSEGHWAYPLRYRYAGDYRDGIAVVQRADGLHSHIDRDGGLLHDRWFTDLDVFHKGLARARDAQGWMHVDGQGQPVYTQRFAAVEPFYNGQARVETHEGALLVIAESGDPLLELRPPSRDEFHALSSDLVGFWRTESIAAAVHVGLFEALPATLPHLAAGAGWPQQKTLRLLRALQELALVHAGPESVWVATPRGQYLHRNHRTSLAQAAVEHAGVLRERWASLEEALATPSWTLPDLFEAVARDPSQAAAHHAMLASYARKDYEPLAPLIPLEGARSVLDAGGGTGVLAALLMQHHPGVDMAVLERPEVATLLDPEAARLGVRMLPGSLFDPWPAQVDAVLLARVLHDWDDPQALRILERARAALTPGGRLFVLELLLDEASGAGGLCDIHLLVVTGGRERTLAEFSALFERAGLRLVRNIPTGQIPQILVVEVR